MNKTILVISDSTGETANQVLDAVKVHFYITDVDIKKFSKINKKEQIDEILDDIKRRYINIFYDRRSRIIRLLDWKNRNEWINLSSRRFIISYANFK